MLQMPLLNLDLDVRENGEIKPISIEMNKEELQNLINALEAANKVTDAVICSRLLMYWIFYLKLLVLGILLKTEIVRCQNDDKSYRKPHIRLSGRDFGQVFLARFSLEFFKCD